MKAVLLVNLGSPKDLNLSSIKDYLTEFLTDDNVVDLPKIIQKILVKILSYLLDPRKPKRHIALYGKKMDHH